jgi:Cdc6-like AAA superfamily ATPase
MRPRDLIGFLRQCVSVAVNRGNSKVLETDILKAEKQYSEDQLQALFDELRDINSQFAELSYAFIGSPVTMTRNILESKIQEFDVPLSSVKEAIEILLWFGFFGIVDAEGEEKYAHMYQYGVKRMLREASEQTSFVIHPAFRSVLACGPN